MPEETYVRGVGIEQVTLRVFGTGGNGFCCFLTGGERPHVGAVALAAPGALPDDLRTLTLPEHRDAEIAAQLARRLCEASGEAVSVTAGLHIDHATRTQIEALCENSRQALDEFIQRHFAEEP